ncbi:WS/DGAT/MGAT family O-acyltransferase [Nocardioides limicola]|uniref:WS/DGAT/MGAT family O-acyltransferase n=1 Tax=Nocardioides limicola TaxID=2803368 RepID=UPI00193C5926|nr:wax ester/triacylglycerol synthase family O-acyltransferase [Nocardioides sp. DJM-14]
MHRRLRPQDLSLLALESPATPLHNVTVEILDPADSGFDHGALLQLIEDRIAFVPRYRQRLHRIPGGLAPPIWLDDPDFDLGYHVRRSALPRPGSEEQLRELVSRIMSRPLDLHRPLWEVYLVEGLADGRLALLSKSHQILVDGVQTVDLGQVLLDVDPEPRTLERDDWTPARALGPGRLVADAVRENVADPGVLAETVGRGFGTLGRAANHGFQAAGALAGALAGRRPTPESPLHAELSEQRRFVTVRTDLADYRKVRRAHGGTVNDVILAALTGALRNWLMTRTESMAGMRSVRAMVPMSVIDDELEPTSLGSQIMGHLVTLPIGEPSPVVRLHQVSYAFKAHSETGRAVAANRLAGVAGFAPTTFHALGTRVALDHRRAGFHVTITNVPGPQFPLFAAGARMEETYPAPPLLPGHALAIGVTSYDGQVFFGFTADRDALPDVEILAQCLTESLEELVESASGTRARAPRGRGSRKPGGSR